MLLTNCPVCNTNSFSLTNILMPEGVLKSCNSCSQIISQCSKKEYESGFSEFNTEKGTMPSEKSKNRSLKRHKGFLDLAMQYVNKDKKDVNILDIGCSSGSFLQNAKTLGFKNLYGVEPAKKASKAAQDLGFNVTCGIVEELDVKDGFFDIITIFEVIEHLTNPISVLNKCKKLLSKNGVLLIGTGNTDSWTVKSIKEQWGYFSLKNHGGHISFFNPKSMQLLANNTNFKLEKVITRAVKLHEKYEENSIKYKVSKVLSELLNIPAKFLNKGHDMLVILTNKN